MRQCGSYSLGTSKAATSGLGKDENGLQAAQNGAFDGTKHMRVRCACATFWRPRPVCLVLENPLYCLIV
jgi:hypothetical protein